MEGHTGPDAAGKVIEAFGHYLVGGNYTVGIVVFIILVVINSLSLRKAQALPKCRPVLPSTQCQASKWPSTQT